MSEINQTTQTEANTEPTKTVRTPETQTDPRTYLTPESRLARIKALLERIQLFPKAIDDEINYNPKAKPSENSTAPNTLGEHFFPNVQPHHLRDFNRTAAAIFAADAFFDGDDTAYAYLTGDHPSNGAITKLTFKYVAEIFEPYRDDLVRRELLNFYLIARAYATTPHARKRLYRFHGITGQTTPAKTLHTLIVEGSLPGLDHPHGHAGYFECLADGLSHVTDLDFGLKEYVYGEIPAMALDQLFKLTTPDAHLLFMASIAEIAGSAGDIPFKPYSHCALSEPVAADLVWLYDHVYKPHSGRIYLKNKSKPVYEAGYHSQCAIAATRISMLMGYDAAEAEAIAHYLAKSYPAYENLISELSLSGDFIPDGAPLSPAITLHGAHELVRNTRVYFEGSKLDNPLETTLSYVLPFLQRLYFSCRYEALHPRRHKFLLDHEPTDPILETFVPWTLLSSPVDIPAALPFYFDI